MTFSTCTVTQLCIGIYHGNIYVMIRTSLFIDARTMSSLKRAAQRRGVSVAAIVREAVAVYLSAPSSASPVPSVAGRFASGRSDTADRAEELLWRDPHA